LEQFNFLQLSVKLQLEVVDDVPEVSSLILQLFVLNLELDDSLGVRSALLNRFLELILDLFELGFER